MTTDRCPIRPTNIYPSHAHLFSILDMSNSIIADLSKTSWVAITDRDLSPTPGPVAGISSARFSPTNQCAFCVRQLKIIAELAKN